MPQFVIPPAQTIRLLLALAAATGVAACVEWDRSTAPPPADIRVYVTGVQAANGTQATFFPGSPPAAGTGPVLTASIPQIVLKGGSAEVTFNSVSTFSHLVISVEGSTGYWDLDLGAPTSSATVLLVYAQKVGSPSFWLQYAGGTAGATGPVAVAFEAFLGNGTGDVQVNITWNSKADVDLYVVDPFGDELYWNHRFSNSGGLLDIDSNAGCVTDGPRAENVFWPFGTVPPSGEYVVRVNYWSECGETSTDYVVTIRTSGGTPTIYRGRFTGAGVGGAAGAGRRIAAFTF